MTTSCTIIPPQHFSPWIAVKSIESQFALVGGIITLSAVYWFVSKPFLFPLDDAYITIHNAQALLLGHDSAYGVSPLVGATSLFHLALVAAVAVLLPPVLASYGVAVVGTAVYALGLLRLAAQYELTRRRTIAILLIGLGAGTAIYQLLNGLETVWAMAAVTWAIVLAKTPGHMHAILCGLMPFVRPELAILSSLLLVRQALIQRDARIIAVDICLAFFAAAPWLIWSWRETGVLLPSTAAAKAAFFAEAQLPLGAKFALVWSALWEGIGIFLLPLLFVRRTNLGTTLLAFVVVFLALFAATFPGGLFHNYFRYQFVLLPIAVWAICDLQTAPGLRRLWLPICAVWAAFTLPLGLRDVRSARPIVQDGLDAAAWANANLPEGSRVLVHDAGEIAYASSNLTLIDIVGLKRPASIPLHRNFTLPTNGTERWRAVDAIARQTSPQYAEISDDPFWGALAQDLRHAGWKLELVRTSTVSGGYNVFRLGAPSRSNTAQTPSPTGSQP